ncbi:MAG: hypothetical protein GYA02_05670 [Clostridiaceae bacterium]|nr:hypothetical protein [Clostridiaceae bacterium]
MDRVLREERKFLISIDEFMRINHKIEQIMQQDSHNGVHGYIVRSLYFRFDPPLSEIIYVELSLL